MSPTAIITLVLNNTTTTDGKPFIVMVMSVSVSVLVLVLVLVFSSFDDLLQY
jgi:hypothetical protein